MLQHLGAHRGLTTEACGRTWIPPPKKYSCPKTSTPVCQMPSADVALRWCRERGIAAPRGLQRQLHSPICLPIIAVDMALAAPMLRSYTYKLTVVMASCWLCSTGSVRNLRPGAKKLLATYRKHAWVATGNKLATYAWPFALRTVGRFLRSWARLFSCGCLNPAW